ncbi:2-oxoglutarate-dependent dioxygenase, partial [Rhizobium leguminosarum]|nr:2-oxoglutarate-dependent dioxygenase [Rhizobium leguminosarum]
MREMDAAWREWLATNVSRGCTQESMIEAMVQGGFEIDAAREIVRRAASETGAAATVAASPEEEARAYH